MCFTSVVGGATETVDVEAEWSGRGGGVVTLGGLLKAVVGGGGMTPPILGVGIPAGWIEGLPKLLGGAYGFFGGAVGGLPTAGGTIDAEEKEGLLRGGATGAANGVFTEGELDLSLGAYGFLGGGGIPCVAIGGAFEAA